VSSLLLSYKLYHMTSPIYRMEAFRKMGFVCCETLYLNSFRMIEEKIFVSNPLTILILLIYEDTNVHQPVLPALNGSTYWQFTIVF
jgi:hypothetical protein